MCRRDRDNAVKYSVPRGRTEVWLKPAGRGRARLWAVSYTHLDVYKRQAVVGHNHKFTLGVVCGGSCTMEQDGQVLSLKAGDSFLIAAGTEAYQIPVSYTHLQDGQGNVKVTERPAVYIDVAAVHEYKELAKIK